ncbi:hypothetical protein ABZ805_14775 [Saccharopolyspora sp. NPDC047091]|uniref:hypothetical protein n=1 Tax=Saccharopolyspora sp. NPDC047091 TaxID=3155924 RepID=UPI0033CA43D4
MGHYPEPQLHRWVLARLGAAGDELAGLLGARGRDRIPHEFLADPARIDAHALCLELDERSAVRSLRLPEAFLDEVAGARAPERLPEVLHEVERLDRLRELRLPPDVFADVPPETVDCWRHRALNGLPIEAASARLPLLAALCWHRQGELTRELLTVLLALIDELRARAGARLRAAEAEFDGRWGSWSPPADHVNALLHRPAEPVRCRAARAALHVTYTSDHRELLAALLHVLDFRSSDRRRWPLLAALGELLEGPTRVWGEGRYLPSGVDVPVRGVVPAGWLVGVVDRHGRVDRTGYELCVLLTLREAVREGAVTVPGSAEPRAGIGRAIGECLSWPPDAAALSTTGPPLG